MTWQEVAASFHVTTVDALLSLPRMARYQEVRSRLPWLGADEPPLGFLFLSHRWASPEHPDQDGRLMRSIQAFLRLVPVAVEAMLVPREARLRLLPSISREGALQAEEVARRLLGFGPFAEAAVSLASSEARRIIVAEHRAGRDGTAFRTWLAQRIGVWLDYVCMPQRPLSHDEEAEFDRTLKGLDRLAQSALLLGMREAGDDYSARGWCLLESFLGSGRSFARGISVDGSRLERGDEAAVPPPPAPPADALARQVIREAYDQDVAAYLEACDRWVRDEPAFVQHVPPDAWSAYRSLQGSAFPVAASDPNPFRPALELVRELETSLVERWLMGEQPIVLDLGAEMGGLMARHRVRCADADQLVLGFTLASNGWMASLRPLFRECLRLACDAARLRPAPADPAKLVARLLPIEPAARALFSQARPASPGAWYSRLSQSSVRERAAQALLAALEAQPPGFEMLSTKH